MGDTWSVDPLLISPLYEEERDTFPQRGKVRMGVNRQYEYSVRGEPVEGLSNAWESCESSDFNRTPGVHVSSVDGTDKSTVPFNCNSPGPAQTSA